MNTQNVEPPALRVVVGEDDVLLQEGIAGILVAAGFDVVARAGDADDIPAVWRRECVNRQWLQVDDDAQQRLAATRDEWGRGRLVRGRHARRRFID